MREEYLDRMEVLTNKKEALQTQLERTLAQKGEPYLAILTYFLDRELKLQEERHVKSFSGKISRAHYD